MSDSVVYKYPLKLPHSLKDIVRDLAKADGVSVNQWIVTAVAQKVGAVQTAEQFFAERAAGEGSMSDILKLSGDRPPMPGDELPDELREKWEKRLSGGE
ncbi:hypothetical protein [Parvularcula maris]|uniref:Toxin-antitoxin system HicB family antitoxin n=1 Tax=Parvularcula maris TaxID=2965077 RepID=A0A9X2RHJ1_9PROT|nr:hypothetical protein [Parvularcula maris]MCQ8183961.1 hypothetical protein [Parvularcula maris]